MPPARTAALLYTVLLYSRVTYFTAHRARVVCTQGGVAQYERWREEAAAANKLSTSPAPSYGVHRAARSNASASAASAPSTLLWHPASDCPRFYSDPTSRRHYQAMARALTGHISRYSGVALRDDPVVMGWELCNECRCRGELRAIELQQWIGVMAPYVKSIAPRQLLGVGGEGLYRAVKGLIDSAHADALNPSEWYQHEGVDFLSSHMHDAIDYASYVRAPTCEPLTSPACTPHHTSAHTKRHIQERSPSPHAHTLCAHTCYARASARPCPCTLRVALSRAALALCRLGSGLTAKLADVFRAPLHQCSRAARPERIAQAVAA